MHDSERIKLALHRTKMDKEMDRMLKNMGPMEPVLDAGAGNMILKLIQGKADGYLCQTRGMGRWDFCAPEALLKGMYGYPLDFSMNPLRYEVGQEMKGAFMARTPSLLREASRRFARI